MFPATALVIGATPSMARFEGNCPTRMAAVLLLWLLPSGCAVHSAHDRGSVSEQVRVQTGHELRPAPGSGSDLPEGVSLADGLSENEAVAVALWRNADLEVTLAELGLGKADLVEAGLIKNPIFSILFPLGPKQLEYALTWPIEALWQRPRRVAAAQADMGRLAERLVQSGLDLVRDVRLAYADALLDEERVRLAAESRDVRERIAAIAEVQLRVGDISALEAASVQVEAARARDEAGRAVRISESSHDRLRTLLGVAGGAPAPGLVLTPAARSRANLPDLDALLQEALAARPELRALEIAIETAGKRAGLAKSEILTLSAILDANGNGTEGFEMGPGLAVEIPIFNRQQGRVTRAQAELEARRLVAIRERIALEVGKRAPRFSARANPSTSGREVCSRSSSRTMSGWSGRGRPATHRCSPSSARVAPFSTHSSLPPRHVRPSARPTRRSATAWVGHSIALPSTSFDWRIARESRARRLCRPGPAAGLLIAATGRRGHSSREGRQPRRGSRLQLRHSHRGGRITPRDRDRHHRGARPAAGAVRRG